MNPEETLPDPHLLIALIRRHGVAVEIEEADLAALATLVDRRRLEPGEELLSEGKPSSALYLLVSGALEVVDLNNRTGGALPLRVLDAGAIVGEISFLDRRPASATVRATEESQVLVLSREALESVPGEAGVALRRRILAALTGMLLDRLRKANQDRVTALESELDQARLRAEFGTFFIVTLVLFGLAGLVQDLISDDLPPIQQMAYSWGFLLLTLAPIAWFTTRQRAPLSAFGLTLAGWRRSLAEGLGLGALIAGAMLAWRALTREAGAPLLTWGSVSTYDPVESAVFFALYGPHCFLQEFIGRGAMQTSLTRFMPESHPFVPIVLVSMLFGIFHFYVSYSFALVTFLVSLIFGAVFARHRTLLGVTLLHLALGIASVAIGLN